MSTDFSSIPSNATTADLQGTDLPALGCVVMASGLGRRFGSNKLLEDLGGMPLILHTVKMLESLPFLRIVVVTRSRETAALCRKFCSRASVLLHGEPYRSDTVRLGLSYLLKIPDQHTPLSSPSCMEGFQRSPILPGCFFCLGDQPLLTPESVKSMAQVFMGSPAGIFRLSWNGHEGSPVLFSSKYFPELLSLPQGKGGGWLAKKYPGQVVKVPARNASELIDIDTPEDLAALRQKI